ncbi:MAG: type IV pilus modification protein PilV [Gammaproteobacteria bacterium]|nr:type IV pilus modification protein PilV [Gammaproteobacteria bacterium]
MTTHSTHAARSRSHQGFTLLEVLIALLVLSIGLLGIGKMMMLSARANDSAYMRSQATALAYTILDAMRANRTTALAQGYDNAVPAAQACALAAPGCTGDLQASNDMFLWNQNIAAELPGGTGTVATLQAPNGTGATDVTATVTVTWIDKVADQSFGAGNPTVSVVLETVL